MKQAPAITVLLPIYNSARFLAETIQSVLDQTFIDFELLIIDDLSTDGCQEIIRSFTDPRIRMVFHERNTGLNATLNEGLELARGSYIARMDGDDIMHPQRLQIQKDFLDEHPDVVVVASTVELINTDGEVTGVWDTDQACITPEEIRRMMPKTNCIAHPSVMIRRSALGDERYSLDQKGTEDWDLWLRLLSKGNKIAKIPEPLLRYRMHPGSMTGIAKRQEPLEKRLMRARRGFALSEWRRGRINSFHTQLANAHARNFARHLLNTTRTGARSLKRAITYSPLELLREERLLERTLREWKGRHVFFFPHMRIGGAELVHARIAGTIADHDPLIIIHGFSNDRSLAPRFEAAGTVIMLPHLLNHPLSGAKALEKIARRLNELGDVTVFGSLSTIFFDILPQLNERIQTIYLQHAFLFQPRANLQQKGWLKHFPRVDHYVFVSRHALEEFKKFLFADHIPKSEFHKLKLIPNMVEHFQPPADHERIGLLFVGRDSSEKRLHLFLEIVRRLRQVLPGSIRATVVGPAPRPGVPDVDFPGPIADHTRLMNIYADHDVLVLTSSREGSPLVVMEAMAMGLAVIATPVGDIPWRLKEDVSVTTTTIEADAVVQEMTTALIDLVNDRDRLVKMRKAAYQQALQEFTGERSVRSYRELLLGASASI